MSNFFQFWKEQPILVTSGLVFLIALVYYAVTQKNLKISTPLGSIEKVEAVKPNLTPVLPSDTQIVQHNEGHDNVNSVVNGTQTININPKETKKENNMEKPSSVTQKGNFSQNQQGGNVVQNYYEGAPPPEVIFKAFTIRNEASNYNVEVLRNDTNTHVFHSAFEVQFKTDVACTSLIVISDHPNVVGMALLPAFDAVYNVSKQKNKSYILNPPPGVYTVNVFSDVPITDFQGAIVFGVNEKVVPFEMK